ncbi:unnamed protein product [Acidithrix sp. C25]|nr:unnamed protein product [Acidithrix sp. C25]
MFDGSKETSSQKTSLISQSIDAILRKGSIMICFVYIANWDSFRSCG